jgi:hypothetical protein
MNLLLTLASISGTIFGTIVVPAIAAGVATVATLAATRASDAATKRRDGYADAVETLVAWIEFSYRIRRRVDDKPETLTALANLGHELQERLARHEAWMTAEHGPVADAFRTARREMGGLIAPSVKQAWDTPPIKKAADMNLGDWGPGREAAAHVKAFQEVVETRFGWCRLKTHCRALGARGHSSLA